MQAWHKLLGGRGLPPNLRLLLEHAQAHVSAAHGPDSSHSHSGIAKPQAQARRGALHAVSGVAQRFGRTFKHALELLGCLASSGHRTRGFQSRLVHAGILKKTTVQFTAIARLLMESWQHPVSLDTAAELNDWGVGLLHQNAGTSSVKSENSPLNVQKLQKALEIAR